MSTIKQIAPGTTYAVDRNGAARPVRVVARKPKQMTEVSYWEACTEHRAVVASWRVRQTPALATDLRPRLAVRTETEQETLNASIEQRGFDLARGCR